MGLEKSILISGYYGFDNSGDDAILKAIVKDIKQYNKNIRITVLSNDPDKTESMYDVKAVNRFKLQEVIRAINSSSLLISGGGSLLQDITSTRSLLYYLALMTIAKLKRKPVMVYANGIGPIDRKLNRLFAKEVLNKVDLITLRDEDSRIYLESMKVNNKNIFVTADPVFTLEAASKDRINEIFNKENIPKDKKLIGLSLRYWKKAENLKEVISDAIDNILIKYDANVLLIPMHYPEDLQISMEIMDMVAEKGCYILKEKYSVEEIMGVIRELDLIIAMRLHSLIYAATQEVPMVGLVYDPKVIGILNSLGMRYMVNVENLSLEDLMSRIHYVWNNKEELRSVLKEQDDKLKEKALLNVTMAMNLLGAGD